MRSKQNNLIELGMFVGAIFIAVLILATIVSADVKVPEKDVIKAVQDYVRGTLPGDIDVEISCRWRGDARVEGTGSVSLHALPSKVKGTAGGVPVRLEFRRGEKFLRHLIVTANLAYYDTVAVASIPLRRGDALTSNSVRFERREVTQMLGRTFSRLRDIEGLQVRGSVPVGRIVDERQTDPIPIVERGQAVTIHASVGACTVSTRGKALSSGAVGDHIFVENSSGQKIQGRVAKSGVVEAIF